MRHGVYAGMSRASEEVSRSGAEWRRVGNIPRLPLLAATLLSLAGCGPGRMVVEQPLRFDHALHAEEELGCLDCHLHAEEGPYAALPSLESCLLCHEEAQGEDPEEPRVREFAERDEPIPWVGVNRLVGHVYFSHAPHVVRAKMDCSECHGAMATRHEVVDQSQVDRLTMKACMDCHAERGASNDCLSCHK